MDLTKISSKKSGSIFKKMLMSEYFVLYLTIVYFLILVPFVPGLGSMRNLSNVFSNMWPLFAVAMGQTVILILGLIDLSQVSIIGLTSVIGAMIMSTGFNPELFKNAPIWGTLVSENGGPLAGSPLAVPAAIIVMLLVGVLIGFLNGVAISKLKMTPFMVTLVSQLFFLAFAIYLTKSQNIMNLPQGYKAIGTEGFGFIPYSLIIMLILAIIVHFFLSHSMLGRWFYAVGTNQKASAVSGIPTDKVIIYGYMFSGFCAAVSSVLYSSRLGIGQPTMGNTILMDVIGATVIGGTSMFGGKGKVVWTLLGVFFFTLLANTLNLLNLSYFTINIVKGIVILIAAFIDVTRIRIVSKQSGKAGA
ncbi:ABC transporter permease [Defluviitalea saccharophila]|uniref:ABC transporter permease n=1 Tax=Defluviitalea saccharophila TaxID=879970 RepID=A0ABZ2Y312_9FIRM|nr:ABC transporter permease [Candidatus Epulonipiscium sp.]